MNTLVDNLAMLATKEGYNRTPLRGVGVYQTSESSPRIPQGQKRVFFDQQAYDYNPNNYLVLTLPMPLECETHVEPGKPLLSLIINFDVGVLNELVRLFECQCTAAFMDTVTRLSECLNSPLKSDVLGRSLVREVMYHVLMGPQAAPMFALVSHNTSLSRLERVLKYLHHHYQDSLDVEQLASMANMSTSVPQPFIETLNRWLRRHPFNM